MRVVVMGPSGSGKSTVGAGLARRLGAIFIDADDLHPAENIRKMSAGIPLDDDDRMPWLRLVGQALAEHDGVVVACSALKRSYRDAIRAEAPDAVFAELVMAPDVIEERMRDRADHFMPPALLQSQLRTLEPLATDEPGVRVPNTDSVTATVDAAAAGLGA